VTGRQREEREREREREGGEGGREGGREKVRGSGERRVPGTKGEKERGAMKSERYQEVE
jgi:hypothetical protein